MGESACLQLEKTRVNDALQCRNGNSWQRLTSAVRWEVVATAFLRTLFVTLTCLLPVNVTLKVKLSC